MIIDRIVNPFDCPVGTNVSANALIPALAATTAGGADFIRISEWANDYVANEGFMEGRA